jgi:2-polyprenyl-3-methyl-5-hydroxy-6-metoxy-1,4-benzoquinol methylase
MPNHKDYFTVNKQIWNNRVSIHVNSEFYDVSSFKKGKTSLNEIELNALGNVKGKSLLHLQCHFGMDSISWAKEGAIVTGMDFSEEAINTAKCLAEEMNAHADFICSDVYDLPEVLKRKFDIVFTSYGVIGWLPDLDKWAEVIGHFLKPGGIFFIAEFHPVLWMMDDDFTHLKYPYFNNQVIETVSHGTYAERDAAISSTEYGWNHSLDEVISCLLKSGLQVCEFKEYPYSYYNCFNNTIKGNDGNYRIKGLEDKLPMMYSIKAIKNNRKPNATTEKRW